MKYISGLVPLAFLCLSAGFLYAAECIPDLGPGNLCAAKDFTVTETLISGPPSCVEGENIPGTITLRIGILPTANERYDIGFFIGDYGGSPIQGESCTFTSLDPIESGNDFDGLSGSGPYRNLDENSCGDTLKSDGTVFRDIDLDKVVCQDSDSDGQPDITYSLTWQQQAQECYEPNSPPAFFPPNSSKCIIAVGNMEGIEILPPALPPSIHVVKNASPSVIEAPSAQVKYLITVTNTSSEAVVLTGLEDNVFGTLNGQGTCSYPITLEPDESYSCKFTKTISGSAGSSHINSVTATAEDNDGNIAIDSDDAQVDIVEPAQPSGSIGDLIWNDENGDGLYTPDEPGIQGANIDIYKLQNGAYVLYAATETDEGGHYVFNGLSAGSYRIAPDTIEAPLSRMIHTGGAIPHDVVLEADAYYQSADFGFTLASIELDKTADPSVANAPSAAVDFTVRLTNTGAVPLIPSELFDTRFGNLAFKGCILPPLLSSGSSYSCSFTETIAGNAGDEHVNTAVVLARDQQQSPHYAADSAKVVFKDGGNAAIGDFIWNDLNNNGNYDLGEPFIDDVTIELREGGTLLATTKTSNNGFYRFNNLSGGNYTVTVTDDNDVLQSSLLTTSNQPYSVNLSAGEVDNQANFGYVKAQITISKTADKRIIYTPGGDVDYSLLITNPGSVDLTITELSDSKFGSLSAECGLSGLPPGSSLGCSFTRSITGNARDVHTNAVTVTAEDSGGNEFFDSDRASVLFVANQGGTIGSQVWLDLNGDGILDQNEPGIDGVTLDLTENGSVIAAAVTEDNGQYLFDVANGIYEVRVTDKANILNDFILSGGTNPWSGIVIFNSNALAVDFGYAKPPVIPAPSVMLEKSTNGEDADSPPGPEIRKGAAVSWEYAVTNNGNTDLTDVQLTDNRLNSDDITCQFDGDRNNNIFILPVGETVKCRASGKAAKGQYSNVATVSAITAGRSLISDSDASHYYGRAFPWHLIIPPPCPAVPDYCYVVADGDNFTNKLSPLYRYHFSDNRLELLGILKAPDIEAIALSLDGKTLYGADRGILGEIRRNENDDPIFFPLDSSGVGTGNGELGFMKMDDIDGLAFDPTDGTLYGSVRVGDGNPGEMDLLIRINPSTGRIIKDGFGADRDYLLIDTQAINVSDVDDLAIDSQGRMFAVVGISGGGGDDNLVLIDKLTGSVSLYAALQSNGYPIQDMEGLTFYNSTTLFGTSGIEFGSLGTSNNIYRIEKTSGEVEIIDSLSMEIEGILPSDFEAISCYPICR